MAAAAASKASTSQAAVWPGGSDDGWRDGGTRSLGAPPAGSRPSSRCVPPQYGAPPAAARRAQRRRAAVAAEAATTSNDAHLMFWGRRKTWRVRGWCASATGLLRAQPTLLFGGRALSGKGHRCGRQPVRAQNPPGARRDMPPPYKLREL
eukprot:354988-Chlamydomonas_euryale.AAC.2